MSHKYYNVLKTYGILILKKMFLNIGDKKMYHLLSSFSDKDIQLCACFDSLLSYVNILT